MIGVRVGCVSVPIVSMTVIVIMAVSVVMMVGMTPHRCGNGSVDIERG